jgi:phosphoglycolate phosphatase-like HAD superfamily hydrolase
MRVKLTDKTFLIKETCDFISKHHKDYNLHIVSGSDEMELKFLCQELGLFNYFKSIHGSPTPKNELVKNLLTNTNYIKEKSILIGDAINDYEAAINNGISFWGYNNEALKVLAPYIESFPEFEGKILKTK